MRLTRYKWILPLLWLLLTAVVQLFLLQLDYSRIQKHLSDEAGYLYDSVYDRTRLNEVLLQNFSIIVDTHPNDHLTLRRFATTLRARYPHVERLQVQQRVNATEKTQFEQSMRTLGYSYFTLRSKHKNSSNQDLFFPFTFIEPFNSETRRFLGLDMSQEDRYSESFLTSIYYRQPVATKSFELDNGNTAYTLYQAVYPNGRANRQGDFHVVSLVINYKGLLPASLSPGDGMTMTLLGANHERLVQVGNQPTKGLLPVLTVTHTLNRFGQPLQLQLSRAMVWTDINWVLMIGVLLFSLALLKFIQTYLEQKYENKAQREAALLQLELERNQLESHVSQRTQELNAQLLENQRLAHRVMEVQEQERRHLARELHDELGQSLTAIRTDVRMLKNMQPDETSPVFQSADSIDTIAQHIYGVTYDLMRYLRPTALDDLGLVDALRECIANLRVNDRGIRLNTSFSGALNEMSETYNITLYRLVQESLTNILRHADASQINLHLDRKTDMTGDHLEVSITDNGQGFITGETAGRTGFGLIGMRERVNALRGKFSITSTLDQGTRVDIRIPLPASAPASAPAPAIHFPEDEVVLQH
ncbi:MAG: CHASE domain-containing protein [Pontibacterium sp.]